MKPKSTTRSKFGSPSPGILITNPCCSTDFKLALKSGLYDFTSARDSYREAATAAGVGMHRDIIMRYIELQALMLAPIAPHWAEYVWLEVLKKVSCIWNLLMLFILTLSPVREHPLRQVPHCAGAFA